MSEYFPRTRKMNAAQRHCVQQGKMVFQDEDGKIRCRKQEKLSRTEMMEAKSLVKGATIEEIKGYLEPKGFRNLSQLKKDQLIRLIFRHTDPATGDVILFRPAKSSSRKREKESRKRSKESRQRSRKRKMSSAAKKKNMTRK